jgi:hypothetical protein
MRTARPPHPPRLGPTRRQPAPSPASRKTLIYLILALNHIYPDYDFSRLRAHHFKREAGLARAEEVIDSHLLEVSKASWGGSLGSFRAAFGRVWALVCCFVSSSLLGMRASGWLGLLALSLGLSVWLLTAASGLREAAVVGLTAVPNVQARPVTTPLHPTRRPHPRFGRQRRALARRRFWTPFGARLTR